MFCKNCGKELNPLDKFCNNCGTPIESTDSVETAPINELPVEEAQVSVEPTVEVPAEPTFTEVPVEPVVTETPVEPVVTETPVEPVITEVPSEPTITDTPVEPVVTETPAVEPAPVTDIPAAPVSPVINNTAPVQKKSNAGFIVIIIILALIILGVGGFIAYKVLIPKKDTPSTPAVNTPSTPTTPTPVTTEDTTKYSANGYVFTIPSGFEVYKEDGDEFIRGKKSYFTAVVVDNQFTYEQNKQEFESIDTSVMNEWNSFGFYLVGNKEITYEGKKFYYVQFYNTNNNLYSEIILTELSDGKAFACVLYYQTNDGLKEGYDGILSFVNSAKKDNTGTFANSKITGRPGFKKQPNITLE